MRDGAYSLIPMSPLEPLLDGLLGRAQINMPLITHAKYLFIKTFKLLPLKSFYMHLHMGRSLKSYIMRTFNRGMIFDGTLSGPSKGQASWSLVFKAILKKRNVSKAQYSLKKMSSFVSVILSKEQCLTQFHEGGRYYLI